MTVILGNVISNVQIRLPSELPDENIVFSFFGEKYLYTVLFSFLMRMSFLRNILILYAFPQFV